MTDRDNEALQRAATELDPGQSAEEKAERLTPELEKYTRDTEAKERDDLRSEEDAPKRAADGVAEHEKDMARRGFEKEGPPE